MNAARCLFVGFLCLSLQPIRGSAQTTGSPTIVLLPTLGGGGETASSVNDFGDAAGAALLPAPSGSSHAVLWHEGTVTDLGVAAADHDASYAFALNNARQVVGYSVRSNVGRPLPFLWENGTIRVLPLLPGHTQGQALAINKFGQIAGNSQNANFQNRAVTWIDGIIYALPDGGTLSSSATGINDGGQIVGNVQASDGSIHHVIWDAGSVTELPLPTLPSCLDPSCVRPGVAFAINNSGDVSGVVSDTDDRLYAIKWMNGVPSVLASATTADVYYHSISNGGDVVGNVHREVNGVGGPQPTLWSDGASHALPLVNAEWPFGLALGISGNGSWIAGVIASTNSESRAVLWRRPVSKLEIAITGHDARYVWPPNGKLVAVTITGTVTGDVKAVTYAITDEYGAIEPSGSVAINDGHFTVIVRLEARRRGTDRDGRNYSITVSASEPAGGSASATAGIVIPHDSRRAAVEKR